MVTCMNVKIQVHIQLLVEWMIDLYSTVSSTLDTLDCIVLTYWQMCCLSLLNMQGWQKPWPNFFLLMQKAKNQLSTNERFGHFLGFGLLDGLDNAYDGTPKCLSMMAMVIGHANTKIKAKE